MSHANSYRLSGPIQARRMMTTTRCWFVSALLFTCLFLGYLRAGSGQAPPQTPPPGGNAAAAAPATGATIPAVSAKEKPIRDLVNAFAKAYSTPDLKALAALFTDEANVVDSGGEATRAKSAVVEMYSSSFEENPRLTLEPKVQEIQFNKDSVKISSIDRIIGGQIAPDIADVVMVRKPPQPSGTPTQPATAPAQTGTGTSSK